MALGPANRIAVINGATHEIQKYLLVGQRVWHMAFTPDEKYLLTTNGVSNDVSIIDVANLKVTKTIPVGRASLGYRNFTAVTASAFASRRSEKPLHCVFRMGANWATGFRES